MKIVTPSGGTGVDGGRIFIGYDSVDYDGNSASQYGDRIQDIITEFATVSQESSGSTTMIHRIRMGDDDNPNIVLPYEEYENYSWRTDSNDIDTDVATLEDTFRTPGGASDMNLRIPANLIEADALANPSVTGGNWIVFILIGAALNAPDTTFLTLTIPDIISADASVLIILMDPIASYQTRADTLVTEMTMAGIQASWVDFGPTAEPTMANFDSVVLSEMNLEFPNA